MLNSAAKHWCLLNFKAYLKLHSYSFRVTSGCGIDPSPQWYRVLEEVQSSTIMNAVYEQLGHANMLFFPEYSVANSTVPSISSS